MSAHPPPTAHHRGTPMPSASPAARLVTMRALGIGRASTRAISAATLLLLLLAWWVLTYTGSVKRLFLPSPAEVLRAGYSLWNEGYANATLWEHVRASLARMLSAAAIAIGLGVPVGLGMGLNRWVKGICEAPIALYWPLPPLAYLPLMIVWLGIGETSKISLLAMAMFAPVVLATQAGVVSMPPERAYAAQALGATRLQLLTHVVLPSALPQIFHGIRIALGVGWSTLVAAELIAATRGVGYMIMSASEFLATDTVFVGIAAIALCAYSFSLVMRLLERFLLPWVDKA